MTKIHAWQQVAVERQETSYAKIKRKIGCENNKWE